MENDNKILHELKEISPSLIQFQGRNPYTVSFTYFTDLSEKILGKIEAGEEPVYFFTREIPYSAPVNYFETLPQIILRKTTAKEQTNEIFEEMEKVSPLLNTISKKPVYTVPNAYFEKAEWNRREIPTTKGKVISFRSTQKILRFVAAAVITGILAMGIFLFTGKQNAGSQASAQATTDVKKLSEEEIIDFLKTTSPTDNIASANNASNVKDNEIKSSVSSMSDDEIKQFLQENGEQDEM